MSRVEQVEGYRHAADVMLQAVQYPAMWYGEKGPLLTAAENLCATAALCPKDYGDGMRLAIWEGLKGQGRKE